MTKWVFGSYKWQGNPKALLMYMHHYKKGAYDVCWLAETSDEANMINELGYPAVYIKSKKAKSILREADVYITENFREMYPTELRSDVKIINLWHGVGLKHIELALGESSALSQSIVRKYIRNYATYKNNLKFLTTSKAMEEHFLTDMPLDESQIIRGGYPRNTVYKDEQLRTDQGALDFIDKFSEVFLFAPTYRFTNVNGSFKTLLPNLEAVENAMAKVNGLFVLKLHPFMLKDPEYIRTIEEFSDSEHIYFWDDKYDVYEIFNKITVGVIDYSSIFYDLLENGVKKFVRYIPDYQEYVNDLDLIGDYFALTDGVDAHNFSELLDTMVNPIPEISKKDQLLDYFFEFGNEATVEDLILEIENATVGHKEYPELHTFDIFDTLIRRNTVTPESIFQLVQREMEEYTGTAYPKYLLDNYATIRHQVEMDLRDVFRKTTFERGTDKIEVTLREILERLQDNFKLDDAQVEFLMQTEIVAEIAAVEPITKRINELFALKDAGHDVLLISDMYLPADVISRMIAEADVRLTTLPLYVSSEIGYQKSTGRLYTHVFFDLDYHYSKWVHHGDNKRADGRVPKKFGIETVNHDMASFLPFESNFVEVAQSDMQYDASKIATLMQRRRWEMIDDEKMTFNDTGYFTFSYLGSMLVPYVNWAIKDAVDRGYETLYFISRDGYYLKQIADVLIAEKGINIKTKYIYGSRKAWRVPSFINEVDSAAYTPFGMFSNLGSFDELVVASGLEESELLSIIPELEGYRNIQPLTGNIAVGIRELFAKSATYNKRLLEVAADRRGIVSEYLKQEINFEEKFAFVEYWGRGYTQDTLSRLLNDAAGKDVQNPFYYIRNYTDNIGTSIRHRFTQMPSNFTALESIFATTPYKSIPGYERGENNVVKPIMVPRDNDFHRNITEGLESFAKAYANTTMQFEDAMDRFVSETAYKYFFEHLNDQFVNDVFAEFKDNVSMYGEPVAFAPKFTLADIANNEISELRKMTKSMTMSISRSSEEVRTAYIEKAEKKKISTSNVMEKEIVFPKVSLSTYVELGKLPATVITATSQYGYGSIGLPHWSRTDERIPGGEEVTVFGIDWTTTGVPRLRTKYGYLPATSNKVVLPTQDKTTLLSEKEREQYVSDKNVKKIVVLTPTHYYTDVYFEKEFQKEQRTKRGQILDVLAIEWNYRGIPRLKTKHGYITANKNFVSSDLNFVKHMTKKVYKRLKK